MTSSVDATGFGGFGAEGCAAAGFGSSFLGSSFFGSAGAGFFSSHATKPKAATAAMANRCGIFFMASNMV
jgi:hypothetical protein